jgi:hypothetical protein
MKEHPILFSAPMVRAILDGRKTQTRRVVKFNPWPTTETQQDKHRVFKSVFRHNDGGFGWLSGEDTDGKFSRYLKSDPGKQCPYGMVGDRLWVRETFCDTGLNRAVYRVDTAVENWKYRRWRPSIFMPRWAARITLEIVRVGVERLQTINEVDARAEGVEPVVECVGSYTYAYAQLWDVINKKRGFGWKVNPWVWVVSFRKL